MRNSIINGILKLNFQTRAGDDKILIKENAINSQKIVFHGQGRERKGKKRVRCVSVKKNLKERVERATFVLSVISSTCVGVRIHGWGKNAEIITCFSTKMH